MEGEKKVIILAAAVAVHAACAAVCAAVQAAENEHIVNEFPFDAIMHDEAFNQWFRMNLRCSQVTFHTICALLRRNMHAMKHHHRHSFEKIVGATLFYLGSEGGFRETAQAFGMSKSWCVTSVNKILYMIAALSPEFIRAPDDPDDWSRIERGFAARAGFPDVYGAVDGTLFEISRPSEYDGWYCRKGYPAVNMQAVVDDRMHFMSFDIRPGSWNDRKIWAASRFGSSIDQRIPSSGHVIGDAGYTLDTTLLTPYIPHEEAGCRLNSTQRNYNFLHSSTRMVIECAFGLLKNRFRILKRVLEHKKIPNVTNTIVSCMVLHNVLINLGDEVEQLAFVDAVPSAENDDQVDSSDAYPPRDRSVCCQKRDDVALYLFKRDP